MSKRKLQRRLFLPQNFRDYSKLIKTLENGKEEDFEIRGQRRVLRLFHDMAERVPAYKDFLKKNKVDHKDIKNIDDFKKVPTIDKNNYLRKYPLEMLSWDGKLNEKQLTICTTSGSTGEPFYFPHEEDQDWQYVILAELYLRANFQIDKKTTLYVNGFPMGAWIGGTFTHRAVRMISEKGPYKLSIISPGIHKEEIIKAIKKIGHKFDQVIIGSYGPFMKDIIDDGIRKKIKWDKYNLGMVFSAEGFTEKFRDYVCQRAGIKDPVRRTLNHYGTVDLGTMAYETPLSILYRKIAVNDRSVYSSLWGDSIKLPTLTQYVPELFYFEEEDSNLLCSAYSGLPLVRYELNDIGGTSSFSKMKTLYEKHGYDFKKEIQRSGIEDTIWKLPFVWVFERNDFSVSFFAFQIYPATIRKALQMAKFRTKITGKFTMLVNYDRKQNQYLEVNIELMKGKKGSKKLEKEIKEALVKKLLIDSSEYRETYKTRGEKIHPRIVFWEYEDPHFFRPGIKQKWVK